MHQKLNLYTSYYILVTLHYMQYIYTACCTYITSHCTETFKICLSDHQDLHVKMNLTIYINEMGKYSLFKIIINGFYYASKTNVYWKYFQQIVLNFCFDCSIRWIARQEKIYNNKNFWQKFSIRHDYITNSWILEKPGNSWRILENLWTSKTGFIPDFLFIPNFILNSRILPSKPRTTILWSYLKYYI